MSRRTVTPPRSNLPWSNIDPERRNTVLLVGGIVLVVLVSLVLAGYGYYNEKVAPKRETVLRVGERSWNVDQLQRRTNAQIINNNLDRTEMQKNIAETLRQMRDEELVRQIARTNGIKLTEAQLLDGYRARFGLQPEASRDLVALNLRSELRSNGLTLDEFDDIVRAQTLDKMMNDKFREAIPARAPHVSLGLIQLGTQSQAIQLRQVVFEEKETFAVVAARESSHPSKDKAGDVGWIPREALPKEVGDIAFSRDEMFLSDVIENEAGFFIIAVRGKEERDMTEENKELIIQQKRAEQLSKATDTVGVANDLTQAQERRIAVALSTNQVPAGA